MIKNINFVEWGGECVIPVLVKHTCPKPVTGLVSRLVSRTPHKTVVSKTSEADIWLSSYDLTDVGGQREGGQQLSQTKGAFFLLNEKEA